MLVRHRSLHPQLADPLAAEFWPHAPANRGRAASALRASPELRRLPRFAAAFGDGGGASDDALPEGDWWDASADTRRLGALLTALSSAPAYASARRICVVTHAGFLRALLGYAGREDVAPRRPGAALRTAWVAAAAAAMPLEMRSPRCSNGSAVAKRGELRGGEAAAPPDTPPQHPLGCLGAP